MNNKHGMVNNRANTKENKKRGRKSNKDSLPHKKKKVSKPSHPHKPAKKVKPVTGLEKVKHSLKFYRKFGFYEPYNILFDSQFLMNVVIENVQLDEQLQRILRTDKYVKFCSKEVIDHLRAYPNDQFIKAVVLAKKFQRPIKTKKEKKDKKLSISDLKKIADDNLLQVLGENNSRKFIVALGDAHLRSIVHEKYPFTPTLRVIRETIAIDSPSKAAKEIVQQKEQKLVEKYSQLTPWEREQLLKLENSNLDQEDNPVLKPVDEDDEESEDNEVKEEEGDKDDKENKALDSKSEDEDEDSEDDNNEGNSN